jgi:multidrug efflux pump subunit AcrB
MAELNEKYKDKEFGLSSWAVNNRTTVLVITVLVIFAGLSSYINMPREAFPDVVMPEIYVGTPYPGNSPADMEKLITRPMEKEINTITGIDDIISTSVQGYSTIQVKFDFDVTPTEALRKVKDAVDKAQADPDFPKDLPAEPNVFETNFAEMTPVMNINLSGNYAKEQLKDWAELLEDRIEDLPQISQVDIRGVPEKEVRISIDLPKMESRMISFTDVVNAIQSENVSISGGDVLMDGLRRTISVNGEFTDMDQIRSTIVKQENLDIVRLGEIAEVDFTYKESESFSREFGEPVVLLDVKKRAGENLIELSEEINKILEEAVENNFPSDLRITITADQSDATRTQVGELENSIIFGVILVVLVLLFFLGLRNALFVGVAIPLSMFISFMILGSFGVTLNMMVLFSLVLALGMLVDNGVVVVENTYRLMSEGQRPKRAAKNGVGEVAWPIIASTATTLAAFFPLLIWPGLMGEFMKFLPITLMIVLGSSLFVALVINPVLTSLYMRIGDDGPDRKRTWKQFRVLIIIGILFLAIGFFNSVSSLFALGTLCSIFALLGLVNLYYLYPASQRFQNRYMPALEERYKRFLSFTLSGNRPRKYFLGTFGLLILSFVLVGVFQPKVEFFPINMPQYVNIYIEKPIGTDILETNKVTKQIEKKVLAMLDRPEYKHVVVDTLRNGDIVEREENFLVTSVIAQVGEGASDPMEGPAMAATPHKARIQVSFVKFADRKGINTTDVMEDIRAGVRGYPGTVVTVDKNPAGPPQKKPINIEVKGDDIDQLLAEAEKIKRFVDDQRIEGIEELKIDVKQGKPEMPLIVDRAKARRFNVSSYAIGDAVRTALYGREVSTYKLGEDDYEINVRAADKYRYDPEALTNMRVTFRDQSNGKIQQVPISAVAHTERTSTYSSVMRRNLKRMVSVQSNVVTGANANEIVARIQESMKGYEMPLGTTMDFTGQMEEQAKEMGFLSKALLIAVFLIFLIIVSQFNSSSTPLIILTSVFFSLIGVLLGLIIFNMDFIIIMTMIGIISLAGVVVNNAIVLIDYINLLRDRRKKELGLDEDDKLPMDEVIECIVEGGKRRLRPVLLTAITTILGLVPLAIGLNIDFISLLTKWNPNVYMGGDNVIFWGPMSWTVIFGLTFATFLTLVIVPIMYLMMTRLKYRVKAVEPVSTIDQPAVAR